MRPFILVLFITLSLPFGTTTQQDSIDIFIINQMKQQGIPGLSIGIIKNGKVIKAKGYGQANIELNVPASEKTIYKILPPNRKTHCRGKLYRSWTFHFKEAY